jgi:hypothetical protein
VSFLLEQWQRVGGITGTVADLMEGLRREIEPLTTAFRELYQSITTGTLPSGQALGGAVGDLFRQLPTTAPQLQPLPSPQQPRKSP